MRPPFAPFLPKSGTYTHVQYRPTVKRVYERQGEACTTYKQEEGGIYREVHTREYQEVSLGIYHPGIPGGVLRCIYHPGIPGGVLRVLHPGIPGGVLRVLHLGYTSGGERGVPTWVYLRVCGTVTYLRVCGCTTVYLRVCWCTTVYLRVYNDAQTAPPCSQCTPMRRLLPVLPC